MRVAIVALGPSYMDYLKLAEGIGNRDWLFDEVWAINGFGYVIQCDRVFHMDDVRIQEIRAKGGNKKIAGMLEWLKSHPGPIYTSRTHPDYPGLVPYPLQDVLNSTKRLYFNNTVAYAIGLYVHEMIQRKSQGTSENESLSVFGADYTYADRHYAEKGRACCEFWLGMAAMLGARLFVPQTSTMMDQCEPLQLYGYDTLDLTLKRTGNQISLSFKEKDVLPSADDIEAAYNHDLRTNGHNHEGTNGAGSEDQGEDHPRGRDGAGLGDDLALAQKSLEAVLAGNRAEGG